MSADNHMCAVAELLFERNTNAPGVRTFAEVSSEVAVILNLEPPGVLLTKISILVIGTLIALPPESVGYN